MYLRYRVSTLSVLVHSSRHCRSPFCPRSFDIRVISARFFLHSSLTPENVTLTRIYYAHRNPLRPRDVHFLSAAGRYKRARDKKKPRRKRAREKRGDKNCSDASIKRIKILRRFSFGRGMRLPRIRIARIEPRAGGSRIGSYALPSSRWTNPRQTRFKILKGIMSSRDPSDSGIRGPPDPTGPLRSGISISFLPYRIGGGGGGG